MKRGETKDQPPPTMDPLMLLYVGFLRLGVTDSSRIEKWNPPSFGGSPNIYLLKAYCVFQHHARPPLAALLSMLLSRDALHGLTFATCPVFTPCCTPSLWRSSFSLGCFFLLLQNPYPLLAWWLLFHLVQGLNPLWNLLPIFLQLVTLFSSMTLWTSIRMFILFYLIMNHAYHDWICSYPAWDPNWYTVFRLQITIHYINEHHLGVHLFCELGQGLSQPKV